MNSSTPSVRSLPFWWRVTRYDPARRDERGAYRGETWTSISDVGKVFEGHKLTIDEYERVETAYVDAFVASLPLPRTAMSRCRPATSSGPGNRRWPRGGCVCLVGAAR
jgi:hypothetical protein